MVATAQRRFLLTFLGVVCLGVGPVLQGVAGDVPDDPLPLILEAAQSGDPRAEFNLGVRHWFGKGVRQDRIRAVEYFRRAAARDFARAQFFLGTCYADGEGVAVDSERAIEWYTRAAENGCLDAQVKLADMYTTGKGTEQDYELAMKWLRAASDSGHVVSQCNIGIFYMNGLGVEADPELAAAWFRRAAEAGDAQAQYYLGRFYHESVGHLQDRGKAAKWLTEAARVGHADAQFLLGMMYYRGEGVPLDYPKAYCWTMLAAEQGQKEAVKSRYVMRRQMSAGQIEESEDLLVRYRAGDFKKRGTRELGANMAPADVGSETCVGFLISEDGFVLTTAHAVKGAFLVKVRTSGGLVPGTVVHVDTTNDVAVVKVTGEFDPLRVSQSPKLESGDPVLTLDYPGADTSAGEAVPITGRVGRPARVAGAPSYVMVDLAVPVGNSGCPLIDRGGNVVGMLGVRSAPGVLQDVDRLSGNETSIALDATGIHKALQLVGPVAQSLKEAGRADEEREPPSIEKIRESLVLVRIKR